MMPASSFVDPSTLSLQTPASPSPSHDDIDPTHESGPSRKRSRNTSEERKEARAHRNRIAAQNSRDRRKAQFSYLERRVTELEEENRRLRAGAPSTLPLSTFGTLLASDDDRLRTQRENERERENEQLKARIRALEQGWEVVVKALAAHGLPTGLPSTTTTSTSAQSTTPTSSTPPTTTPPPIEASSKSAYTAFPSPTPSHDSLEFDPSPSHSPVVTPNNSFASIPLSIGTTEPQINDEPTRHLARVATIEPSLAPMSLQRVVSSSLPSPMPYIRALQLKQQQQQQWTTTRRWKISSVRFSRRQNQRMRRCCLLRIHPQRK